MHSSQASLGLAQTQQTRLRLMRNILSHSLGQAVTARPATGPEEEEEEFTHPWQPTRLIGWNNVWGEQCHLHSTTHSTTHQDATMSYGPAQ